jgi:hypothetical protein
LVAKITPLVSKITPITTKISNNKTSNLRPESIKPVKVQFEATEKAVAAPVISSDVNATFLTQKKSTPNFKRMHEKQFNNSKPITSFVERVRNT